MESEQLVALFKRGLIPGPGECEEAFLRRVQAREPLHLPEWQDVAATLSTQWGFSIDWVPLHYSSKKLLPWEGAVFWTIESDLPLIQLRPSLQTKNLWGNCRSDILLHEAVHAARETFNEPKFEEFLAYTTSKSLWKRLLGPLFQRPWEFPLFAFAIFLIPLFPWMTAPVTAVFLGRFFYKHLLFHRLKQKLPLSIILCLTDQEIRTLAFSHKQSSSTDASLRWKLIEALKEAN